jgi:hypothetical protein
LLLLNKPAIVNYYHCWKNLLLKIRCLSRGSVARLDSTRLESSRVEWTFFKYVSSRVESSQTYSRVESSRVWFERLDFLKFSLFLSAVSRHWPVLSVIALKWYKSHSLQWINRTKIRQINGDELTTCNRPCTRFSVRGFTLHGFTVHWLNNVFFNLKWGMLIKLGGKLVINMTKIYKKYI